MSGTRSAVRAQQLERTSTGQASRSAIDSPTCSADTTRTRAAEEKIRSASAKTSALRNGMAFPAGVNSTNNTVAGAVAISSIIVAPDPRARAQRR
jgi:hypothetical protein